VCCNARGAGINNLSSCVHGLSFSHDWHNLDQPHVFVTSLRLSLPHLLLPRLSDIAVPVAEVVKGQSFHDRLRMEMDILEGYDLEEAVRYTQVGGGGPRGQKGGWGRWGLGGKEGVVGPTRQRQGGAPHRCEDGGRVG
jgi:hypothetical protein